MSFDGDDAFNAADTDPVESSDADFQSDQDDAENLEQATGAPQDITEGARQKLQQKADVAFEKANKSALNSMVSMWTAMGVDPDVIQEASARYQSVNDLIQNGLDEGKQIPSQDAMDPGSNPFDTAAGAVSSLSPEYGDAPEPQSTRDASDAMMQGTQERMWKLLGEAEGVTPEQIKDWKAMNESIGKWEDNFDKNGNLLKESPLKKMLDDKSLENAKTDMDKALEKSPKVQEAVKKAAAEEGKESGKSKWEQFKSFLKALLGLGGLGFACWFAYQYAADHTGCFSYVGSLGANKMGCSDTQKSDWQVNYCNCGGGFLAGQASASPITKPTTAGGPKPKAKAGPPNTCPLGGSQAQVNGRIICLMHDAAGG